MKLEISESLIYSYLRHVKNCYIAQTNWKTSAHWQPSLVTYQELEKRFADIAASKPGIFISGFDQTIKQAEIDVIGIDNNIVYAVEIAYHENGLQYAGNKSDLKVIMKMLRAFIILNLYFPDQKHVIMFCSPRVRLPADEKIKEQFEWLTREYSDERNEFSYISNQRFKDEIFEPTLDRVQYQADTGELFARAYRLMNAIQATKPIAANSVLEAVIRGTIGNKKDAAEVIQRKLGINLNDSEFIFSNINTARPVWWLEPENAKFGDDLSIVLNNRNDKKLFFLLIPKGTILQPEKIFYQKQGARGKSQIIINVKCEHQNDIFIDEKRGFNFGPFVKETIDYSHGLS